MIFRIVPAGDVDLDDNGAVILLEGAAYVRQKLATKFKFFLGEWFLNQREGVPYRRDVLVKNPDLEVIRALFRDIVRSEPQVTRITRFDLVFDKTERLLAFAFAAALKSGETLIVTPDDDDFLLPLPRAA